jgi:cohesin complex subunit SA-1/2
VCTALCDVAAAVSSELSLRQRQRDAEAKKNAQGPAGRKRLADLEAKCGESQTKKAVLDEMMKKTLDT